LKIESEAKAAAEIEKTKAEAQKAEAAAKAEVQKAEAEKLRLEAEAAKLKLEAEAVKVRMDHEFRMRQIEMQNLNPSAGDDAGNTQEEYPNCQAIQSIQPKSPSSWNLGRITFGVCVSNLVMGYIFSRLRPRFVMRH